MYRATKSKPSVHNVITTHKSAHGLKLRGMKISFVLIYLLLYLLITSSTWAQTQPPPLKWKKTYPLAQNAGLRLRDFTYLKSNHSYYVLGELDLADCVNNKCQCDIYTDSDTSHNGQVLYQLDEAGDIIKKICLGKTYVSYRLITT
jgi:hypothetical protein